MGVWKIDVGVWKIDVGVWKIDVGVGKPTVGVLGAGVTVSPGPPVSVGGAERAGVGVTTPGPGGGVPGVVVVPVGIGGGLPVTVMRKGGGVNVGVPGIGFVTVSLF